MDKYSVSVASCEDREAWDSFVGQSDQSSIFHYYDWLKCAEEESGYQLIPLVVEKHGQGRICQFPVFTKKKRGFSIVCSPPPGCAIPNLGPITHFLSENQYRIESDTNGIILKIKEYIEELYQPDYQRYALVPDFSDVRSFVWKGYDATPLYTYQLSLGKKMDDIYDSFDSRIRKGMKKFKKNSNKTDLLMGGSDLIIDSVNNRYNHQNLIHSASSFYIEKLLSIFPDKIIPFSIFEDSEFISGILSLNHKEKVQLWIGGVIPANRNYNGVNEFLQWSVINHSLGNGKKIYEDIGANTPHLCDNKSKYNFKPVSYFLIEKKNNKAKLALTLISKTGLRGSDIQKII